MGKRLPIVGIGARNLPASVRFYTEAMGLDVEQQHPPTEGIVMLTDHRRTRLAIEPRNDGRTSVGGPIPTIANLGMANLTFHAPALDPVLAAVEAAGGRILWETRVSLGADREGIFVADPDGLPIELITGVEKLAFIHVVSCVSDLERSAEILTRLGYAPVRDIDIPNPIEPISKFVRLADARLRGRVFAHEDGGEIEFIEMLHPKAAGRAGVGPGDTEPGLLYIAIDVGDIDAATATLQAIGLKGMRGTDPVTGRSAWLGMDFDSTRLKCLGDG